MEEMEHEAQHAADPVDRAGAEVEANDREALRNHQLAVAASGDLPEPKGDGMCSDDCGEPVEPARLALGLGRCLSCAEEHERLRLRRLRGF